MRPISSHAGDNGNLLFSCQKRNCFYMHISRRSSWGQSRSKWDFHFHQILEQRTSWPTWQWFYTLFCMIIQLPLMKNAASFQRVSGFTCHHKLSLPACSFSLFQKCVRGLTSLLLSYYYFLRCYWEGMMILWNPICQQIEKKVSREIYTFPSGFLCQRFVAYSGFQWISYNMKVIANHCTILQSLIKSAYGSKLATRCTMG